jgi:hypothetical protein
VDIYGSKSRASYARSRPRLARQLRLILVAWFHLNDDMEQNRNKRPKKKVTQQEQLSHLGGLGRNRERVGMTSALIFGLYLVVTTRARKVSTHSFMSLSYHGRLLWHAIGVVDESTTTIDGGDMRRSSLDHGS